MERGDKWTGRAMRNETGRQADGVRLQTDERDGKQMGGRAASEWGKAADGDRAAGDGDGK